MSVTGLEIKEGRCYVTRGEGGGQNRIAHPRVSLARLEPRALALNGPKIAAGGEASPCFEDKHWRDLWQAQAGLAVLWAA